MAEGPVTMSPDEKNLALFAHILGIFTFWVGPLVIYLVAGDTKPFAKQQAQEALNWQITVAIGFVASTAVAFVGFHFLYHLVYVANLIFCIMGAMAVSKGEAYKYPFALRLIK